MIRGDQWSVSCSGPLLLREVSRVPSEPPNCSQSVINRVTLFLARVISSTQKMEVTRSFETSVYNKPTRSGIPEDGILPLRRVRHTKGCGVRSLSRSWIAAGL
jgi:hypothetical protein